MVNYRSSRARPLNRLSIPDSNFVQLIHDDFETNRELNNSFDFHSIKLRRSWSNNKINLSNLENKRGKSMSLLEENENENLDKKQTNRLSGLRKMEEFQKLASMYKKFEQEDSNDNPIKTKSKELKNNLEEKLAFFENISNDQNTKMKLDKQKYSSFSFPKYSQQLKSNEVCKDEGFETQSNSSMSNSNETENKNEKEKREVKRRSVCPIIGRYKPCSKPSNDSRYSVAISFNENQNTKSNSSLYMNETVSTKAKKNNIKLCTKTVLQSQSKSKISPKTSSNSEIQLAKARTISSSSTSTIGSQKLARKNKSIGEKSNYIKMTTFKI